MLESFTNNAGNDSSKVAQDQHREKTAILRCANAFTNQHNRLSLRIYSIKNRHTYSTSVQGIYKELILKATTNSLCFNIY